MTEDTNTGFTGNHHLNMTPKHKSNLLLLHTHTGDDVWYSIFAMDLLAGYL